MTRPGRPRAAVAVVLAVAVAGALLGLGAAGARVLAGREVAGTVDGNQVRDRHAPGPTHLVRFDGGPWHHVDADLASHLDLGRQVEGRAWSASIDVDGRPVPRLTPTALRTGVLLTLLVALAAVAALTPGRLDRWTDHVGRPLAWAWAATGRRAAGARLSRAAGRPPS